MQVGRHGHGPTEFDQPRAVKLDPLTGNIYVVDANNGRVQVWDGNLKYLAQFGKGVLRYPRGIALSNEAIYVTDYFKYFFYKFSSVDFSLLKTKPAEEMLMLYNPVAVSLEEDEVFVLEADKQRISVFSTNLEYLRCLAKGVISVSYDIQVKQGIIHVLEVDTNLIKLLNSQNGELVASVLINYDSIPFSNACHFTIGVDDCYFITDWKVNKVKIISNKGKFIHLLDTSDFQCLQPRGIASTTTNDIIIAFQEGKNVLLKLLDVFTTEK